MLEREWENVAMASCDRKSLPKALPAEQAGTSPSASGPAGSYFEGQVAAHYLLTMLAEADPRGLPGVSITQVQLQRASEGHPLDDVIIHGITSTGEKAVLEIQAKRAITFSPGDSVFKSVVVQLAQAYKLLDLKQQNHQFAVASERNTFKITGSYQEVLRWAREVGSASVFFGRVRRKNQGNEDKRTFVETVRNHLQSAGSASDDETIWQILRRFQILTFDFDAPGSQSLELAVERARNLLHPGLAAMASTLWQVLTEIAIRVAASGGDLERHKLLGEVTGGGIFRLVGSLSNRISRDNLAEAAKQAAADLRPNISGITLPRTAMLDRVREALDHGRYVEIRGEAGVGKSGLLGMIASQVLIEGRAIVLTPERTPPGGWLAFKSALQIEGGADVFLSDLASDGGAILFVDSLDFFDDPGKRTTIIDLVRAATSVSSFFVIVTARTDFDKDEPNWLPQDALAKLGRAPAVVLDELGAEEAEELRVAAPGLRALLADDHTARAVARNLFRLSQLFKMEGTTDQLHSEVDLLHRWWITADGGQEDRRERKRLIVDLADAILDGDTHLDTRADPTVVGSLVASGTVKEVGFDRLVFRHDILRDWGIAARLYDAPDKIGHLPLAHPAPTFLIRGIELCSRLALERGEDGRSWCEFLARVSNSGAHGSWRRWSVLAILRSELAPTLLERASASLMENDGTLLRELIRTTLAVESRPLTETLSEFGMNLTGLPPGIYAPVNGSWARLVQWLLAKRGSLPLQVLPDVVELFQSFSMSMFFSDPLTPRMASALADWLIEIEDAQEQRPLAPIPSRFESQFRYHELQELARNVRMAFLIMAARVPERAQEYLRRSLGCRFSDQRIREILQSRGNLAQAAPSELVDLALYGLIPKSERRRTPGIRKDVFTYLDNDFLPTSPAQGPFLELLNAAPEQGLRLIRCLSDHAIATLTDGNPAGDDGFTLIFPNGPRFFPLERSYNWSRQTSDGYALECGLLALEAWSHARIERGDEPGKVIEDILGPEGSPSAYLLVAVDVLISHWPKTMLAAIPFLGSPELLSIDRIRQSHDRTPEMDLGGWGAIAPKEPIGSIRLADLKKRPSRGCALDGLLPTFALDEGFDRNTLHALLTDAAARLGATTPDDNLAEPRLMVRHALNLINPMNWLSQEGNWTYVSPEDEAKHLQALQEKHAGHALDSRISMAMKIALEDSGKSNIQLVDHAVAYAQRLSANGDSEDALQSSRVAIISAAALLARDGSEASLTQHQAWANVVFKEEFARQDDAIFSRRLFGFNPIAIATLGMIHLWRRRCHHADGHGLLDLLELAGRNEPDAALGFGAGLPVIQEVEPRLVSALLRISLVAQVRPWHRWDEPEEEKEATQKQRRERVVARIRNELAWLTGQEPEPDWPALPPCSIEIRRHPSFGLEPYAATEARVPWSREQFSMQNAAFWLRQLTGGSATGDRTWSLRFVDAYADWTAAANGAGLEQHAEIGHQTAEWNMVFFSILAGTLPFMSPDLVEAHIARVLSVPNNSFYDITNNLVPAIDRIYFNGLGLDLDTALKVRALLADRLMQSAGWRRECDRLELSVEMQIGPAIGVLFFSHYGGFGRPSCYLLPKGIELVDPFLFGLKRLVKEGPVPFISFLTMGLLEVAPRPTQLQFFLTATLSWLQRQPENSHLWVDWELGLRVVSWMERLLEMDATLHNSTHPERAQIDDILARLVKLGVAQAHRLERALLSGS